jgi:hypothetical protein
MKVIGPTVNMPFIAGADSRVCPPVGPPVVWEDTLSLTFGKSRANKIGAEVIFRP